MRLTVGSSCAVLWFVLKWTRRCVFNFLFGGGGGWSDLIYVARCEPGATSLKIDLAPISYDAQQRAASSQLLCSARCGYAKRGNGRSHLLHCIVGASRWLRTLWKLGFHPIASVGCTENGPWKRKFSVSSRVRRKMPCWGQRSERTRSDCRKARVDTSLD